MATKGQLNGRVSFPIYYEDTDHSGFVFHANYLKFFDRAREHIIGIDFLCEMQERGLHFVVSEANLRFRAPLRYGQTVTIISEAAYSSSPIMHFQQQALVGEQLVTEGRVSVVVLNSQHRPTRIPDWMLERFAESQRGPLHGNHPP